MKLTPLEIKQQQFEKSLRGYDVADVQAFLTLVSNEYEHLLTKNKELENQIDKLTDRVKHYERVEEALHETLQTTKESISQKMENARLESKSITDKAQMEAEAIVKEANQQRSQIRQSILRLLDRREEIISGIKSYLENAQNSVEKFANDEMAIFELPKGEDAEALKQEDIEEESETTNGSRFAFDEDEENEGETNTEASEDTVDEDDSAFPPGSDRLNDILDEID
jgi:cell division initiation protein